MIKINVPFNDDQSFEIKLQQDFKVSSSSDYTGIANSIFYKIQPLKNYLCIIESL